MKQAPETLSRWPLHNVFFPHVQAGKNLGKNASYCSNRE
jgi:hypothetical protein